MKWAIIGTALAVAYFWKQSKGPTWKGWKQEIFGEDEE